jgi:hypothetical protein
MTRREKFGRDDWRAITSQIRAFQRTVAWEAMRTRFEQMATSALQVLENPKSTLDEIKVAQGERKIALRAIMINEELLRAADRKTPRRKEETDA